MRVGNNLPAINAYRHYRIASTAAETSAERLASGSRVNRAGDDAAGLAISEKMRAQIRGLEMAQKNTSDGLSLVNTAEAALQKVHDILQRMSELAVQSASDTNQTKIDREALDQEFQQLKTEIDDISRTTRFNNQLLLDGTYQKNRSFLQRSITMSGAWGADGSALLVDVRAADPGFYEIEFTYNIYTITYPARAPNVTVAGSVADTHFATALEVFDLAGTSRHNGNTYTIRLEPGSTMQSARFSIVDSGQNVVSYIEGIDITTWTAVGSDKEILLDFAGVGTVALTIRAGEMIHDLSEITAYLGSTELVFDNSGKASVVSDQVVASLEISNGMETVYASKGDDHVRFESTGLIILFSGGLSDAFIDSKRDNGQLTIQLNVATESSAPLILQTGANQGDTMHVNIDSVSTGNLGIAYTHIRKRTYASNAITEVRKAINKISSQRAALGALQNRIRYKGENLAISSENLTASESRIRDADMAKEILVFSKKNILTQASTAMLAQANALPQNVLNLLR